MRYIVINLSGALNESLGRNLGQHIEDILKEPSSVLFDFTRVTELESSGLEQFIKVLQKVQDSGTERIALSSITKDFHDKIQKLVSFEVPHFDSKSSAKSYLEKMNATKTHESVGVNTHYAKVVEFTQKGDIYYINCPGCSVKLRIRSIGNHACPSCKKRFYFNPNIPPISEPNINTEPKTAETHYEMLALD